VPSVFPAVARPLALAAALLALILAVPAAHAAGTGTSEELQAAIQGLRDRLDGGALSAAERARLHAAKRELIVAAYGDAVRGVAASQVLIDLDCIATELQRARNARKPSLERARARDATTCRDELAKLAKAAGGPAAGLASDLRIVGSRLGAISSRIRQGRAFGSKATALRKLVSSVVARRFAGETLHGISFSDTYDDLECVDVKAEARRVSGALSCAKRLLRRTGSAEPLKPKVTFGSDLSGTATVLPAQFEAADTEFWTSELTVPADGTVTELRLKTGDSPIDLPLRFSVVRPRGDGSVEVITTTNPVFPLPAHSAQVHIYQTSNVSFPCCKVRKGDIVTVDNSGTTQRDAYVWFATGQGSTTLQNTGHGDSQNAGNIWRPTPYPGYEVLLQVELQPS
jgi:hypothetical protein